MSNGTSYGELHPEVSPYAAFQSYDNRELDLHGCDGRLEVARGIVKRAEESGNIEQWARWSLVVNELLDRRLSVMRS